MPQVAPQVVVITGASSGIGRALAVRYARDGAVLGLIGRNVERLEETAALCRGTAAQVHTGILDVRDQAALAEWLTDFDDRNPVDLVIANAGVSGGTQSGGARETAEVAVAQMEINLLGVVNTIHPLMPRMLKRKRGQLALMSSIAAFMPLRDSAAYGATKAALLYYGLALGDSLSSRSGVSISVICPGFVTSPMSERYKGTKPFEVAPDKAANIIHRGLARRKPVIVFPRALWLLTRIGAMVPHRLRRVVIKPFRFEIEKQSDEAR